MSQDQHTPEQGPSEALSAPESASDPRVGVSRRSEALSGPQTGAESLRQRIAEALMAWADGNNNPKYAPIRRPETVTKNAYARADAVLAVVQPELDALAAQVDEARMWARHGYEIGQRHCGWSDHGVAPAWLTEGWPRSFDSCEHLKQAAEFDEALTRVRALHQPTEGLGFGCDEDDTPGSYGHIAQVCTSCGKNDEYGVRWPCPTIRALQPPAPAHDGPTIAEASAADRNWDVEKAGDQP